MTKYGMIQFTKADLPLLLEAFHRMWLIGMMGEFADYMYESGWITEVEDA